MWRHYGRCNVCLDLDLDTNLKRRVIMNEILSKLVLAVACGLAGYVIGLIRARNIPILIDRDDLKEGD